MAERDLGRRPAGPEKAVLSGPLGSHATGDPPHDAKLARAGNARHNGILSAHTPAARTQITKPCDGSPHPNVW